MNNCRTILAACILMLPAGAMAEISFYAGAGVGGLRLEEDLNVSVLVQDEATGGVPISYSFPENGEPFAFQGTDLGARIFGGVRLFELLGVSLGLEGGWVYFGEPEDSLNFDIPPGPIGCNPAQSFSCQRNLTTSRSVVYTDEITGWEIYALAALPVTENLEVFGKIGAIIWESDFTFSNKAEILIPQIPFVEDVTLTPASAVDTDGTDLAGGAGANYKVSERVSVRLEGTWYAIEDIDQLWMISGSFIYGF